MFVSKIGTLGKDDLPPVMDMEVTDGQSPATIQAHMKTWLATVEHATGRKPLLYTTQSMSGSVGTGFKSQPLWVANWDASCPVLPSNFTAWKFWQTSSTAKVPGIAGNAAADEFDGDLTALLKFTNPSVTDGGTAKDAGPAPDAGVALDAGPEPYDGGDDEGSLPTEPDADVDPSSGGDEGQSLGSVPPEATGDDPGNLGPPSSPGNPCAP